MGVLTGWVMAALLAAMPVVAVVVARGLVARREGKQRLLGEQHSHLRPLHHWDVAYASGAHMDSILKLWSWEDVGVLHLYEEALTFYGEKLSFEVDRETIERVTIATYVRTNPLVPWLEVRTTSGWRHYFCLPRGYHVLGMRSRADDLHRAVEEWSRGSSARPLLIE